MNWLTPDQKRQIQVLASAKPEEETCGFVLADGSVVDVPNQAKNPTTNFEISPGDYVRAEICGIKGVWHSHLVFDGFSPLDQQVLAADDLPWAVYCLKSAKFHQCDPNGIAPLLGRPFCFGVYDCYSLVTDKLAELGVQLPAWPRGLYGEWNTKDFRPFDVQAENVGSPVTDGCYKEGDILLMNLGDHPGHTDHVGVFINHNQFLHHPAERESRIDRFGSWWKRKTRLVVRPDPLWSS